MQNIKIDQESILEVNETKLKNFEKEMNKEVKYLKNMVQNENEV